MLALDDVAQVLLVSPGRCCVARIAVSPPLDGLWCVALLVELFCATENHMNVPVPQHVPVRNGSVMSEECASGPFSAGSRCESHPAALLSSTNDAYVGPGATGRDW